MSESPFKGKDKSEWREVRNELIDDHPLTENQIKSLVLNSYKELRQTRIGEPEKNIRIFEDVEIGAQTAGEFLEVILARELSKKGSWRRGSDAEKDLVHTQDEKYSIELKLSGQVGERIYGNSSFPEGPEEKKKKGSYYLTVNTHISNWMLPPTHRLFLIRFGWIDHRDWVAQESDSGHSAKISREIYRHKLRVIEGKYMYNTPIGVLSGIGKAKLKRILPFVKSYNAGTIGDFIQIVDESDESCDIVDTICDKIQDFPEKTFMLGKEGTEYNWELLKEVENQK